MSVYKKMIQHVNGLFFGHLVYQRIVKLFIPSLSGRLCSRHRAALDLCGLTIILILCVVLILILCFLHPCLFCDWTNQSGQKFINSSPSVCLTSECVKTAASLLSAMDPDVDPCEDFFEFACGAWNKRHVIPEDRSSVSTFEVLADQLQIILKGKIRNCSRKLFNVS